MSIDENIGESIMEISGCEENLSEKYDKMRREKMERLYKRDYQSMILVYMMMGMMLKGSY